MDPGEQDLANIIDKQALQSLMDDFYALTKLAIWILDLKGNILVGTGWQDICIKFHRINPQTLKNCIESDLMLTGDVKPGEFRVYKCKNNIWDIVTPLFIGEKHVGNIYFGQFFYEDEILDYEFFAAQAEKYGFNKENYLAALKRVPRWSRDKVQSLMKFYAKFAAQISKLSYSNLKLAKLISDQKQAAESFKEQFLFLQQLIEAIPNPIFFKDTQGIYRGCNRSLEEFLGWKEEEIIGKSVYDLYPKELADIYCRADKDLFDHPGVQIYESLFPHKGGTHRNVIFNKATYYQPDGTVSGMIGVITDITERKQAEETLKAGEARYRQLIETMNEGLAVTDKNLRLTFVNERFCTMLDYPREELLDHRIIEFVHEDFREATENQCATRRTGAPQPYLMAWKKKGGETIYTQVSPRALFDAQGNYLGSIGVLTDITERKQIEDALQKSEQRYRTLFELSTDAIVMLDQDGKFFDGNKSALKMFGFSSKEDFIKMHPNELSPPTQPDGKDSLTASLEHIETAFVKGSEFFEWVHKKQDGTLFLADLRLSSLELGGKRVLQTLVRDITERKKTEEALGEIQTRLDLTLRSAGMGVWYWDIVEDRRYFDNQTCYLLGINPGTFTGSEEEFFRMVHPDDRETLKAKLARTIEQDVLYEPEYRAVWPDGSVHDITARGKLVRDGAGQPLRINGIIWDITSHKQADEQMLSLQAQLQQSQKMEAIGLLAGGVAHDFNNLLTVISIQSQLSLHGLREGDPLKERLKDIELAADRAANLTRQLLAFSRRQILEMKVINPNFIFKDLGKMLGRVIGEDIELKTMLADDLGMVKVDPGQMEQLIINLAVNAKDAMPREGNSSLRPPMWNWMKSMFVPLPG